MLINKIIIHIDGSSQGNPGPSGVGVLFESAEKQKLLETNKFIGEGTNNQAEYEALLLALKMLKEKHIKWQLAENPEIVIKTDSELIYSQITGLYKVKDWALKKLYSDATKLAKDLPKIKMILIPREENRICDRLAKKAIKDLIQSGAVKKKTNAEKNRSLFS